MRGHLALEAYNIALAEGKTFDNRVPFMLIGQDRSGKTSLKKSLRGELFKPNEKSTVGIDVDPSLFELSTEIWTMPEKDQEPISGSSNSYEHHVARATVEHMTQTRRVSASEEKTPEATPSENVPAVETVSSSTSISTHDPAEVGTVSFSSPKSTIQEIQENRSDGTSNVPNELQMMSNESVQTSRHAENEDTTPLIPNDVQAAMIKFLENNSKVEDEEVHAVLWDFAGQSVYYTTHPIFLTPRAIYLLIYDMSRDPNEVKSSIVSRQGNDYSAQSHFDNLEFWLSSISLLAVENNGIENLSTKLPTVFLVCTHADKPFNGGDAKVLAKQLLDSLQNKPFSGHLYTDVFAVDNTKSGSKRECPEIVRLRKEVRAVAEQLLQRKEEIPIKWLKYEQTLQAMREDGCKYLLLDEAKQIACEVCDIRDDEFVTLINFLHDQRILIHFGENEALSKMVVLDPQWLVDVFKKIIAAKPHIPKGGELEALWSDFERTGVLHKRVIEFEWTPLPNSEDTFESLLKIMEKFSLICPWPATSSNEQYLVPSMLKSHPTEGVLDLLSSASLPSLFLKFDSGHVPQGFFPRMLLQFIQWCHEEWSSQRQPRMFNNFARFFTSLRDGQSVILLCHSKSIEIAVHKMAPSANSMNVHVDLDHEASDVSVCRKVRRQLGLMLECMRNEFHWLRNVRYKMYVRCPVCSNQGVVRYCCNHDMKDCKREECLHFLSEEELRNCQYPFQCLKSAVAKDVRVDINSIQPWFEFLDKQVTLRLTDVLRVGNETLFLRLI